MAATETVRITQVAVGAAVAATAKLWQKRAESTGNNYGMGQRHLSNSNKYSNSNSNSNNSSSCGGTATGGEQATRETISGSSHLCKRGRFYRWGRTSLQEQLPLHRRRGGRITLKQAVTSATTTSAWGATRRGNNNTSSSSPGRAPTRRLLSRQPKPLKPLLRE